MNQEITGYPLCWPPERPRTPAAMRRQARFKTSFAQARTNLIDEIRRLGGGDSVFSSDIPRRNDGLPYADERPQNRGSRDSMLLHPEGKEAGLCEVKTAADFALAALGKSL